MYIIIGHITLNVSKFYIENRKRHIIWNIKISLKRFILKKRKEYYISLIKTKTFTWTQFFL